MTDWHKHPTAKGISRDVLEDPYDLAAAATPKSIGEQIADFRARLPQDSPLHAAAFRLAILAGELEAAKAAAVDRGA